MLCWLVRTTNSSSPSSSRSFRTQSRWSFITGQCVDSEQFLRVHLSYRMCNQFTLHHKFRIDTGRTKYEQRRQTVFFTAVNPMDKEHKNLYEIWLERTTPCMVQAEKSGKDIKTWCIGSIYNLLNRKDLSSIKPDRTQSSFTTHSQLVVSRKVVVMKSEEIIYQNVHVSTRHPPKISFIDNWMKELDSEVCWRKWKTPNKSNQKPKTKEINIDFRVSGIATCSLWNKQRTSAFREFVKKIEGHPHREALQADLQQNSVYNPFGNSSKAVIREIGNVELFEYAKQFRKCNVLNVFSIGIKEVSISTCGHLLVECESSPKSTN